MRRAAIGGEVQSACADAHRSGVREAGLDRGWPEIDARRLRTPVSRVVAGEPGVRKGEAGLDRGWPEIDARRLRTRVSRGVGGEPGARRGEAGVERGRAGREARRPRTRGAPAGACE